MFLFLICINVAAMLLANLRKVITIYDYVMIIIPTPVYLPILYLLRSIFYIFVFVFLDSMSLVVLQEVISSYASKINITVYPVQWLIHRLFELVVDSTLNNSSWYVIGCFQKWSLCTFMKWLSSHII